MLAPHISPAKTISGALVGWTVGLLWCSYPFFYKGIVPSFGMISFIVCAPLAVVAGDLGESFLKRRFGLKDTSACYLGMAGFGTV